LDVHVLRDRNPVFVRLHDGAVRNGYTVKIANRGLLPRKVSVSLKGLDGAKLTTPGTRTPSRTLEVDLPANEVRAVRLFITVPAGALEASNLPATFVIEGGADQVTTPTTFLSGAANVP
jgi:polyferredoxin